MTAHSALGEFALCCWLPFLLFGLLAWCRYLNYLEDTGSQAFWRKEVDDA